MSLSVGRTIGEAHSVRVLEAGGVEEGGRRVGVGRVAHTSLEKQEEEERGTRRKRSLRDKRGRS